MPMTCCCASTRRTAGASCSSRRSPADTGIPARASAYPSPRPSIAIPATARLTEALLEQLGELHHAELIAVVAQAARHPGGGDALALAIVPQIVVGQIHAFLGRAVGHDLGLGLEQLRQILLPVGEQQRADAGRLE